MTQKKNRNRSIILNVFVASTEAGRYNQHASLINVDVDKDSRNRSFLFRNNCYFILSRTFSVCTRHKPARNRRSREKDNCCSNGIPSNQAIARARSTDREIPRSLSSTRALQRMDCDTHHSSCIFAARVFLCYNIYLRFVFYRRAVGYKRQYCNTDVSKCNH